MSIVFHTMLVVGLVLLTSIINMDSSSVLQRQPTANNTNKILKLVHTVFRHGKRTPVASYPTDPYINETYYPYGLGELTNEGQEFLFEAGEWLKQRYNDYLGKVYLSDHVYAQTTDYDRTKASMECLLAGLFPPNKTPRNWNRQLNWQPIPFSVPPLDREMLLLVATACTRYYLEAIDAFQPFIAKHEKVFTGLVEATGLNFNSTLYVQLLYSTLISQQEYGLTLPNLTKNYFPQPLKEITEYSYLYNVYTDELKRIAAGPFLQKMITHWQQKRNGTITPADRKIFLYGGHDVTIANILTAIGAWQLQIPTGGIMAIFELLEDRETGEYGIQVYLRTSKESGAIPLTISGCDNFCPLDTFIELTKNIMPGNLTAECGFKNDHIIVSSSSTSV